MGLAPPSLGGVWGTDHSSQPPWLGALVDRGGEAVAVVGDGGALVYANEAAHVLLGTEAGALTGTSAVDLVHPEDLERVAVNLDGLAAGARPRPGLIRLRHSGGSWVAVEISPFTIELPPRPEGPGTVTALVLRDTALQDAHWQFLTALSRGEPFEVCLRALADGLSSEADGPMAITYDGDDRRHVVGDLPPELAGVTPDGGLDTQVGTPWHQALRRGTPAWAPIDALPAPVRDVAVSRGHGACVVVPVDDPGSGRPALLVQWPPAVAMAEILVEALVRRPRQAVTLALDRRNALRRLEHLAHHDDLSGLRNRTPFFAALAEMSRGEGPFGVCYVDLDDFKPVNDTLGHVVGDHTIMVCARRLERLAGAGDVVARLGGDEFAIASPSADLGQLEDLAARIVDALGQPFRIGEHDIDVGASVGCVLAAPGDAPDAVIAAADAALYEAKRSGRRTWRRAAAVAPRGSLSRRLPFPGAATA